MCELGIFPRFSSGAEQRRAALGVFRLEPEYNGYLFQEKRVRHACLSVGRAATLLKVPRQMHGVLFGSHVFSIVIRKGVPDKRLAFVVCFVRYFFTVYVFSAVERVPDKT